MKINNKKKLLGEHIKKFRESRGIKQNWLAKTLGVHPSLLSFIEKGKRRVPKALLPKLFAVIGEFGSDQEVAKTVAEKCQQGSLLYITKEDLKYLLRVEEVVRPLTLEIIEELVKHRRTHRAG